MQKGLMQTERATEVARPQAWEVAGLPLRAGGGGAGRVDAAGARRGLHTRAERDARVSQREPRRRKGSRGRGGRGRGGRACPSRLPRGLRTARGVAGTVTRDRAFVLSARCSGGVSPLRAELGPSFPRREASLGPIPGRAALPQEPEGPALATPAAAQRDDTSFRPARPQRPSADGRLPAAFRADAASHRGPRGLPRCPAHSHSRARRRILAPDSEVPLVCSANTTQAPGPSMSAHLTK